MILPYPTIVIFDMDGTTVRHLSPALLHILEWLDNQLYRLGRIYRWIFRLHPSDKNPLDDWDRFKKRKKPKLLVHRAMHKIRRKEVDQIVEPCPGIYEVLDFLSENNIPMALASNGLGKGYGYDILEKFDLQKYFKATIFREDIHHSKPHPEGILTAIEQTGVSLNADDVIWYIGDRAKDVKAALAARKHVPCQVVPVAYAIKAALATIENNLSPDHIMPCYFDMHELLKSMISKNKNSRTTNAQPLPKTAHKLPKVPPR